MEKTLDIEGLPGDRVQYLKDLIEIWRKQDQVGEGDDDVKLSDFIVKDSDVKGGRVTRAMAYE